MNKKGFTLIELLGVIMILGILAAIGTVSYYKYLDKAKSKSFVMAEKTLMNNAKNAYADCFSDSNNDFCKIYDEYGSGETIYITLSELINYGYSDKIKNPYDTSSYCDINNSYVTVDDNGVVGNNKDILYQVCLICGEHKSENTCDGMVDKKWKDTINFVAKTATYTGNPIVANKATATSKSEITYTYYSSTNCSGTALSGAPTEVGNYSVKATSAGNDYYKPGSKCVTHTIKKDSNAYLSSLSITNYSISPSFSALKENYTATTETANVVINATAESKFSTVIGTGPQNLNWGSNTKSVMVTAQDGTTKTYKITINNKRPTTPVLSISNSGWSTTATSVYVSTQGSAVSGLSSYEYYASTSSTAPTNATLSNGKEVVGTLATGTTPTGAAAGKGFSNEGLTYVWFRSVSTNGFRSVWTGPKITKIDTENPTVTVTLSGSTATLTFSDKQGIVGYEVNQSKTIEPAEYIEVSGTSVTKTWTAQTAGTYVAWVKDVAGRTANYEFTISSNAFCQYDINHEWTFAYTGGEQQFSIPCTGKYKLETWGAQGGNSVYIGIEKAKGGNGGYASGNISLIKDSKLYIAVGGAGSSSNVEGSYENFKSYPATGGYNGGANGNASGHTNACTYEWHFVQIASGGGATHIATKTGLLSTLSSTDLLIVAGGGGGSFYSYEPNENICCSDSSSNSCNQGNKIIPKDGGVGGSTGVNTSFGVGIENGGGGGYYGGDKSNTPYSSSGGGSNYVGGVIAEQTIAGDTSMPTHDGTSTMVGNSGNGYAKITLISIDQ